MSEIAQLTPRIVWDYFDQITRIPRPSKKEEKIMAYLVDFAKSHGLEYRRDGVGNLVIRKPATEGMEDRRPSSCRATWIWCARKTAA